MGVDKTKDVYAKVIVGISHEAIDRAFDYHVPDHIKDKISEGDPVVIPFGKGNTKRSGFVMELTNKANFPRELIKDIDSIDDKAVGLEQKTVDLARWMHLHYGSTMITCMKTVLPVRKKIKEAVLKTISLNIPKEELTIEIEATSKLPRFKARYTLLKELYNIPEIPEHIITSKLGVSKNVIKTLEKNGIVTVTNDRKYRNPKVVDGYLDKDVILSSEQDEVYKKALARLNSDDPGVVLLHGITGSGKTEVYMRLIRDCVDSGKKAIVLIPEIALTFQTLMRFYARFGDRVSVIHSRLSEGERFDQYERAKKGDLDIIIGPRSALFMPFDNIGIIIIDEEHESSYKSEKMPKYHAREVAEYISKRDKALLVLGSATPSIDSYYLAKNNSYELLTMKERSNGSKLATVHVVDLRQELKSGNKSYFSTKLRELMTECFTNGEQAMLFINRRGYAGFISCRECGFVLKCKHCDVAMTEHSGSKMVCHYCGYTEEKPKICPKCGSKYFAGMRAGTEKIEQEIRKLYPSIRTLRMDADTTANKEDYEKILSSFQAGEADVLVGTQMIVKGHDFPNVTLVGVIAADLSLYASDYRATERTFQLITQAAGRAGRGQKKGKVVIQTYEPDNYGIVHSKNQDYESFYEEELLYRTLASYPPISHMLAIQFYSYSKAYVDKVTEDVAASMKEYVKSKELEMIGPSDALISKVRDIYRKVIYIKGSSVDELIGSKIVIDNMSDNIEKNKISIQYDLDPVGAF